MRFDVLMVGALVFCFQQVPTSGADLSSRERKIVETVNATILRAGRGYVSGEHENAAADIRKAMDQLKLAVGTGNPDLYDALVPAMKRISKAHAMLELEGVSLPPFKTPKRPEAKAGDSTDGASDKESMNPAKGPATEGFFSKDGGIQFTKQVAPILAEKCGRCHIQGSKGGFNTASYAALMKGPPEGVVVFAGDPIGSRLIETIETGDMPRGGLKVTPSELQILKVWVAEGAKFDGDDMNAPLNATASASPTNPGNAQPMIKKATGSETVSFASDIAPILIENCSGCHIDAMRNQGGLRMDTFAQILRGGDSGEIVLAGRGADSLLVKKLRGTATDGARMPAGGRPPLSDADIALVAKWIDEGATLDGMESQPIKVMSQLAWASKATPDQITSRRSDLAQQNLKLTAMSSTAPHVETTEHFQVIGTGSVATIKAVADAAESNMKQVTGYVRGKSGEQFFGGKATIFVMSKRYEYSEFAKMVETRSVPTSWTGHWKFDGIDAYVAVVASDRDEADVISQRLLGPQISLAVATRGSDVPRWFAEGVGASAASRGRSTSRADKQRLQAETAEAVGLLKNAKSFLGGKLTAEQTDRVGAAIATTMLDRARRKSFDGCLRALGTGKPFDQAFAAGFGVPVETYIENFRKWAQ